MKQRSSVSAWTAAVRAVLVVYLVLVPVVFWRGALEPFELCKAGLLHLTALVLAGCLVCDRGWGRVLSWREPIGLALLLGGLSAVVSTAISVSPRTSLWGNWENQAGLLTVAGLLVLFFATRAVVARGDDVWPLAAALTIGVGLCAGYALIQVAGGDPLAWVSTSPYAGFTRPIGMLGHPNYLAGFLVMAVPVLVWSWRQRNDSLPGVSGYPAGVAIALAVLVVLASLSRAAWLAAAVLVVLPFLWRSGRRRWLVAGVLLLLLGGVVGLTWAGWLGPLGQRLRHLTDASSRLAIWRIGWDIFLNHPLTGSGLDTFQLVFAKHRSVEYWRLEWGLTPSRAHNDLLHVLATQGLLGGVALVGQLVAVVAAAARRAWNGRPQERGLLLGLLGAVVAYHVQNLFGFPVVATSSLLAIVLGCLSRMGEAPLTPPAPLSHEGRGGSKTASLPLSPCGRGGWGVRGSAWPLVLGTGLACLVLPANILADSAASLRLWPAALLAGMACLLVWSLLRNRERPAPLVWTGWGRAALVWPVVLVMAWLVVACPLAAWCLVRRGETLQDSDPERAVAVQQRATELAPWLDVPHAHLATSCQRLGLVRGEPRWLRRGIVAIVAARDRVPANALYHANHARFLADLARTGQAGRAEPWPAYDRALACDPRNPIVLADAAAAAVALGEFDQARRYLSRGRALAPHWARLMAEEGVLALAEGRLADAERHLRLALRGDWAGEIEAFGRAQGLLALAYLQLGQSAVALAHADEVLRRHPGRSGFEVATRWVRAAALERLGRPGDARDEFGRVLALRPDHAAARAGLERLSRPGCRQVSP